MDDFNLRNFFEMDPTRILRMSSTPGTGGGGGDEGEGESAVGTELDQRVETPKMYKVLLLNDDYTPMDFVVLVLKRFFGKSEEQATQVMLDVHRRGSGIAGVYTLEVAEMKVMQVNQFAQLNQHPLKSTLEADG